MKLATLFRFVLFATLLGLASNIWMGERAEQLQTSQAELLAARLNAINQLRLLQSEFDALQTLVAAYVASGNSRHLVNYYELLDSHAGERKYAQPVDNTYWSQLIAGTAAPVKLESAQGDTLEQRLREQQLKLPEVSPNLDASVSHILDLSRNMREREQIVFALTQGLYDPDNRQYVSEAPVRKDLAIQMLFSEDYLGLGNSIRAEIQGRIQAVESGFQAAISGQADSIQTTARFDLYLGLLVALMALLGLAVLQRYVVAPLGELDRVSKQIAKGRYDTTLPDPRLVTEMQNLVKGFDLMIGAFRGELEQAEAARTAQLMALEAKVGRERAEAQAQARSMLLANMSHEIRTPMNAILGMTALTLKSSLPEQERSHLQKVQAAARSLLGLLNDVLDFSKAEAGMMEFERIPFTLDEVLANSFLAVQSQAASRKLLLLNQVAPGHSSELSRRLVGDPTRLRQVLSNLLSNAVKFTESGHVRVYSQLSPRSDHRLDLRIEVHDTGSGLSKSQVDRIFEKFAQADSSVSRMYGGTGLGLSIARELVIRMGGEISVLSTPGQGSCFWFSVPLEYSPDIVLPPTPPVPLNCLLIHQAGQVAECLVSVMDSVNLNVTLVSPDTPHFPDQLLEACDWVLLQSDCFSADQPWPSGWIKALADARGRLLAIDRDFLSADSLLRMQLPEGPGQQLRHVSHPVLAQDLHLALFPAAREELEPEQKAHTLPTRLAGKTVLIVEDMPVNQELLSYLLEASGLKVQVCNNGREAIALLDQDHSPQFDLIITDLEMPEVDGYEFTAWLRDQTRWMDTPLLGLTGHAFPEVRKRCMDLGMDAFITKPVETDCLFDTLAGLLNAPAHPLPPLDGAPAVDQLFLKHCAHWPAQLQQLLDRQDEAGFAREIHSMTSILALLQEHELQHTLLDLQAGLNQKACTARHVLDRVLMAWPALVEKYQVSTTH